MKVVKSIWKLAEHNCILSLERNKLNNNCSENTRNIIEGPYTKPFHPRAMTANDIPERVALAITFGFLITYKKFYLIQKIDITFLFRLL